MSSDSNLELSRRKILAGMGAVGVAGAGAGAGTSALFSDEETFEDNTITAGTQNLIVNAGIVDASTFSGNPGSIGLEDTTADGDPAVGITVTDIKPGDSFVVGVDPVVTGNPGYLALSGSITTNSDNVNTEPEVEVDDDINTTNITSNNLGELDTALEVADIGYDSGDPNDGIPGSLPNSGITSDAGFSPTSLSNFLCRGDGSGPPAGHGDGSAPATQVGVGSNADTDQVTHLVRFTLPTSVGNIVQGDKLIFDLTWSLEQVRNNSPPANASEVDGSPN